MVAWIRGNERTKGIRVVLLDKEGRRDDDPPNADLFITKPFNPLDLFR